MYWVGTYPFGPRRYQEPHMLCAANCWRKNTSSAFHTTRWKNMTEHVNTVLVSLQGCRIREHPCFREYHCKDVNTTDGSSAACHGFPLNVGEAFKDEDAVCSVAQECRLTQACDGLLILAGCNAFDQEPAGSHPELYSDAIVASPA